MGSRSDDGAEGYRRHHSSTDLDAIVRDLQVRVAVIEARTTVSKEEFEPIRRLVWGAVTLALTTILTAVLALVIMKSQTPLPPLH